MQQSVVTIKNVLRFLMLALAYHDHPAAAEAFEDPVAAGQDFAGTHGGGNGPSIVPRVADAGLSVTPLSRATVLPRLYSLDAVAVCADGIFPGNISAARPS